MSTTINYNQIMRTALQRVVGDVLGKVAEEGLPGEHHFYISFLTQAKGVDIPAHLAEQYPDEMTIVLQEWFEDLGVMDDRFCVTLSFSGKAEFLVIPFHAITGFADPSENFNLRFDGAEIEPENDAPVEVEEDTEQPDPEPSPQQGEAEIIAFDRFRKSD